LLVGLPGERLEVVSRHRVPWPMTKAVAGGVQPQSALKALVRSGRVIRVVRHLERLILVHDVAVDARLARLARARWEQCQSQAQISLGRQTHAARRPGPSRPAQTPWASVAGGCSSSSEALDVALQPLHFTCCRKCGGSAGRTPLADGARSTVYFMSNSLNSRVN
jgi:hypothetical protein